MRQVLVPTAAFALLVLVGYLLLSDDPVAECVVKTLVITAVFAVFRLWTVRRQGRPEEGASDGS